MSRSLLSRETLMQLGWGMYKAERKEDRLAAQAKRKAQFLRAGFEHCYNEKQTGFVTVQEYVETYREAMIRYGIACGCPFTVEEVTAYLTKKFDAITSVTKEDNLSA